jgi:hypothetical protein
MQRPTEQPRFAAANPATVAAILLVATAGFQAALALGAPWGEAAYGGSNPGVLPPEVRAGSGAASVVYLAFAGIAGTRWVTPRWRSRILPALSVLMAAGAVLNLASPSLVERLIWTPVTVALAVTLWRSAREPH